MANGYLLTGTGSDVFDKYVRQVTVESVYRDAGNALLLPPLDSGAVLSAGGWLDTQAKRVTSTVRWQSNSQNREVTMHTLVTKWTVYPLEAHTFGSGGALHGTEWTAFGLRLAKQSNFNPPVVLNSVLIPGGETVVDMLVDSSKETLYVATAEGTMLSYALEEAGSGSLLLNGSVSLGSTLYGMTIRGNYLYIASASNTAEVFVLDRSTLLTQRSWDLVGTADAVSIAMSVDDATLLVGRSASANEELYLVDPDPANVSPVVLQQAEVGSQVSVIAPYTTEWILFATTSSNKELNVYQVSTSTVTNCNMQGSQNVNGIGIQGDSMLLARDNGPNGTLVIDTLLPSNPSNCSDYDTVDWDNGGSDNIQAALFDEYDQLVYALSDTTTQHFSYNDTNPSTITTHTIESGSDCHTLASDGSLLYAACTNGGTNRIFVLDGGGVDPSTYVLSGTYIFPSVDAGMYSRWKAILPSGTGGVVRYKMRTGSGSADLDSSPWIGPNANSGAFFTETGGTITKHPQEGSRWAQVKAWLSRTGSLSPTVGSVYLLSE
jgi:hypothetical protein